MVWIGGGSGNSSDCFGCFLELFVWVMGMSGFLIGMMVIVVVWLVWNLVVLCNL